MTRLLKSLSSRLREYFDPERLGPLLAEILVDIIIAAIVLAIFYLIWRVLSGVALPRWKRRFDKTSAAFA